MDTVYRCSNDRDSFPSNSKFFICPLTIQHWGNPLLTINTKTDEFEIQLNKTHYENKWWYTIKIEDEKYEEIQISTGS